MKDYDLGLVHWVFRLRVDVFNFITIVTENEEPRKIQSLCMCLFSVIYQVRVISIQCAQAS